MKEAMKEWSIDITRAGDGPALDPHDEETVERVQKAQWSIDEYAPVASFLGNEISFQVAVKGEDPEEAVTEAVAVTDKALRNVDLPAWPVVEIEAVEWTRFEEQLKEPTYPEVVGIAELAEMLKVSKQRASELARDERFPRPHQMLASGPVWIAPNVRDFAATWVRKPGRPRKVVEA